LLRGGQVTVHRLDCHHIDVARQSGDELNLVEVDWVHEPRTVREIHLRVAAEDRSGLTFGLSQIMENEDINISELYGRGERDHQVGLLAATLELSDLRQLSRILHRLAQMPGVRAVQRMAIPPRLADDSLEWAIAQVDDGRKP
jgi:GTP pyrophosphokinase